MPDKLTQKIQKLFLEAGYDLSGDPVLDKASAKAPVNWALVKYWGKRDIDLNIPAVSSLSVAAPLFTRTEIQLADTDSFTLNGEQISNRNTDFKRLYAYLDLLLGEKRPHLKIDSENDVSTASGFASSASGFAACVLALNALYGWGMDDTHLSILARLWSCSACRSIYPGFAVWHKGEREDGMDSFSSSMPVSWPEIRIGMLETSSARKPLGSTQAMLHSAATSPLYKKWLKTNSDALEIIKKAIFEKNLEVFVNAVQANALFMHEVIRTSAPLPNGKKLDYFLPETREALETLKGLQNDGVVIGATMDAGPQVKLVFHEKDTDLVSSSFPTVKVMAPYFG